MTFILRRKLGCQEEMKDGIDHLEQGNSKILEFLLPQWDKIFVAPGEACRAWRSKMFLSLWVLAAGSIDTGYVFRQNRWGLISGVTTKLSPFRVFSFRESYKLSDPPDSNPGLVTFGAQQHTRVLVLLKVISEEK